MKLIVIKNERYWGSIVPALQLHTSVDAKIISLKLIIKMLKIAYAETNKSCSDLYSNILEIFKNLDGPSYISELSKYYFVLIFL